jgi:hypothetical protein
VDHLHRGCDKLDTDQIPIRGSGANTTYILDIHIYMGKIVDPTSLIPHSKVGTRVPSTIIIIKIITCVVFSVEFFERASGHKLDGSGWVVDKNWSVDFQSA